MGASIGLVTGGVSFEPMKGPVKKHHQRLSDIVGILGQFLDSILMLLSQHERDIDQYKCLNESEVLIWVDL